ncbi:ammonium transporter [Arthrobacter sp. 1P04PC]|uniref:ammonium transporter n=1 Tax=Micrococcaceae TaxID=1268 RepID=UPI0039A28109
MQLTAGSVWIIISAALALLMTPALGLFYGGMTRAKASLNMIMMSFVSAGIVGVVWVLWGYSMSTGQGVLGIFGDPFANAGLSRLIGSPDLIKAGFSATFAIITVALISGAIADRTKFSAWALFVPVWITAVYCPLAYMVWGGGLMSPGGAVSKIFGQVIDFAGGTVVEIASGTAALVMVLIVGNRHGFAKDPSHRPHNIPFIMLGAGILWFGWFGFNAGAATTVEQAGLIWVNTLAAPAAAMLSWLAVEKVRHGHPTSLGAASGVVAGLVAITPSCANVSPLAAVGLGLLAGAACCVFVDLKFRFGFDDSLDVVGVHLGGGLIGTLALGFIALPVDGHGGGLFYGGGLQQLVAQTVAVLITVLLSALATAVIGLAIHKTIGFRVSHEAEVAGVDRSEHAETAYEFDGLAHSRFNPFGHHGLPHTVHAAAGHGRTGEPAEEHGRVKESVTAGNAA